MRKMLALLIASFDEKRADSEARKSGPVGKAVNNVKSGYHKNRSQNSADKAKRALKDAG
jgi:hypothetical protein